jgi:hypothetical protein
LKRKPYTTSHPPNRHPYERVDPQSLRENEEEIRLESSQQIQDLEEEVARLRFIQATLDEIANISWEIEFIEEYIREYPRFAPHHQPKLNAYRYYKVALLVLVGVPEATAIQATRP